MTTLFGCCGYDSVPDKDSTLNVPGSSSPTTSSHQDSAPSSPVGPLTGAGETRRHYTNGSAPRREAANAKDGTSDDHDGASSVVTLTPEQKEKEKLRLQALVKSFAKHAVAGVNCRTVDMKSGAQVESMYTLDKSLTTFTVVKGKGGTTALHLSTLQDVYSYDDLLQSGNTEFITKEPGIVRLTPEEKSRLIVVEYSEKDKSEFLTRFCILEHSADCNAAEASDRFITCMKILRLYAITARSNSET